MVCYLFVSALLVGVVVVVYGAYVFAGVAEIIVSLLQRVRGTAKAYIVRLRQLTGIDCPYVYPGLPGDSVPAAAGDKREEMNRA